MVLVASLDPVMAISHRTSNLHANVAAQSLSSEQPQQAVPLTQQPPTLINSYFPGETAPNPSLLFPFPPLQHPLFLGLVVPSRTWLHRDCLLRTTSPLVPCGSQKSLSLSLPSHPVTIHWSPLYSDSGWTANTALPKYPVALFLPSSSPYMVVPALVGGCNVVQWQ